MKLLHKGIDFYINHKKLLIIMFLAPIMTMPFFGFSPYMMRMITLSGIYIILALSLNLLTGFTGQVSLGHAAFYGIGAYTSALLAMRFDLSFVYSAIAGGLVAGFFGLLLGLPTLRLNGTYLSIVTLGFCEITRLVALNWMDLTRGPMGLTGIPLPKVFGWVIDRDAEFFYLVLILIILTWVTMNNLIKSRTGRALISIREDELAAEAMGINILKYKVIAFTTAAFFAGIAGSFYAHYASFIDPQSFTFDESIQILSMVILGGMGSNLGSAIGAVILVSVPEMLRGLQEYRMLMYGAVLVVMMLMRPQGLLGNVKLGDILNKKPVNEEEVPQDA
ncbi:branched-chain amino acid ABC transporter permease [Anaerosolibacter sp.]|uniref:branched-chain amino acid ABC transporter permease n=1 Tax=Anaerosolibacter sp. TaxID=1872527 RepID=UPI0039F0423D